MKLGIWELVIIFAALILLFGGKKIPELMKGIGRGIREFNDAKEKVKSEVEKGMSDTSSSTTVVDDKK